jgi:hypothetical protein
MESEYRINQSINQSAPLLVLYDGAASTTILIFTESIVNVLLRFQGERNTYQGGLFSRYVPSLKICVIRNFIRFVSNQFVGKDDLTSEKGSQEQKTLHYSISLW